MRMKLYRLE